MKTINTGIIAMTGLLSVGITGQQSITASEKPKTSHPNFIIILADDMLKLKDLLLVIVLMMCLCQNTC